MAKEKIIEHVREIKEQQQYYDFFKKLPKIVFWVTFGIFVLIGFFLSINIESAGPLFLCLAIGLILGAISYFLIKVSSSVKIMQTEYLAIIAKKAAEEECGEATVEANGFVAVQNISTSNFKMKKTANGWICPKCGRENAETKSFCIDCGTDKPFKSYSKIEEKEDTRPRWICKECGHSNNPAAKACFNCGKPKS